MLLPFIFFFFMIPANLSFYYYLSSFAFLIALFYTILLVFYTTAYVIYGKERYATYRHTLFIILVILFLVFLFYNSPISGVARITLVDLLYSSLSLYLVIFFFAYFLITIGLYFFKSVSLGNASRIVGIIFIFAAFAALMFYFVSGYVITIRGLNDETYLSFAAVNSVIHGINPYTTDISPQIFSNISKIGATLTTKLTVVGVMDYPDLYFLASAPFYLAGNMTVKSLHEFGLTAQEAIYSFILILIICYALYDAKFPKPNLVLVIFLSFILIDLPSGILPLMLALILFAYISSDNKYLFIILGFCMALQEELWIPILFILAYVMRNNGFKKGMYQGIGTIIVFLLLNSYFIILNPAAFIGSVLTPLNAYIIPDGLSIFGFGILMYYHVLLTFQTTIFIASIIVLSMMLWIFNKKELIFFFSIIPFLFLTHSLANYYTSFIFLFVASLYIEQKKRNQKKPIHLTKDRYIIFRRAAVPIALAVIIFSVAFLYMSHQQLSKEFDLHIANQSAYSSNYNVTYGADLYYSNLKNTSVYLTILSSSVSQSEYSSSLYGVIGPTSIFQNRSPCYEYSCVANLSIIRLNTSYGMYKINAYFSGNKSNGNFTYIDALIYNGKYFYASEPIKITTHSNSSN